jgi:choline dehydrogenase
MNLFTTNPTGTRRDFMARTMLGAVTTALATPGRVSAANREEFDVVIVGAGSSGCVVANRLSAAPSTSVLLLEAGGPDDDAVIHEFAKVFELQKSRFDWQYQTGPESGLNDRRIDWPRGKVFGGSSSLNYMIYIRGHRLDYDHWSYLGNEGWSFDEVLPIFKFSERNETFHDTFHGDSGLLNVAESPIRNELGHAFIEASGQTGFRGESNWDFNGTTQEGTAGFYQHTVKQGKRHSAASAFLTPFLSERTNLQARPWAFVTRVLMENNRATGVEYATMDGALHHAYANEVVLCAGAIDSPQLLLLSGIGPADELRKQGIEVRQDLPGVGRNLQDHICVLHEFSARIQSDGAVPCGGLFVRSEHCPRASSPDIQFHAYADSYAAEGPRFGLYPTLVRPQSLGQISLANSDPRAAPAIRANYLQSDRDLQVLVEGVELGRQLASSQALSGLLGDEIGPLREARTRKEIEQAIRATASTLYHPVGTCKMGHDFAAVVDAQLRVHGIEALRVADASVMPTLVNGNTNAPCIMIGEKAARMIAGS